MSTRSAGAMGADAGRRARLARDARLISRVAETTLRGWTAAVGVPPDLVWPLVLGGYAMAAVSSLGGALWLASTGLLEPLQFPELGILAIVLLVWTSAFTAILSASSAASATGSVRFLRTLPIGERALGAALAIPTLTASALQTCLLVPVMALVIARALAAPVLLGAGMALLASIIGTLQGRLMFGVSRRLIVRHPRIPVAPYLLSVLMLMACLVVGLRLLVDSAGMAPSAPTSLVWTVLGWPGVAVLAAHGGWVGLALVALTIGLLLAAEILNWPWLTAATDLRPPGHPTHSALRTGPPLPLLRLQVVRMLRNERARAVVAALLVLEVVTTPIVVGLDPQLRPGVIDNSILLWSLTASAVPILARGISARHRPFALTVGFDAFRWGTSVAVGGVLIALSCAVLPVVAVALAERSALLLAGGLGHVLFAALLAAALGAVVTPNPGTGPAETLVLGAVLTADLLVAAGLRQLSPIASTAGIGLAMGLLSLPVAVVPGLVERLRWQADTIGRRQPPRPSVLGPAPTRQPWSG